ncbi:uncharacterized protein [Prorops nasuta]|uniref:uncharacterized protein isoform X2 n=1 Tax=Prorops nasuta TaxID=863751 RepID=UPI0034CD0F97
MENEKYKVEVFFIPKVNDSALKFNVSDDILVINNLKENDFQKSKESTMQKLKNVIDSEGVSEFKNIIYQDENNIEILQNQINSVFIELGNENCDLCKIDCDKPLHEIAVHNNIDVLDKFLDSFNICSFQLKDKVQEKLVDKNLEEICCCSNISKHLKMIPSPRDVSQEIFKEKWLKKLEMLKLKETELNNKEESLKNQEACLIKKERELQELEKTLKKKLRQADQYLEYIPLRKNSTIHENESQQTLKPVDTKLNSNIFFPMLENLSTLKSKTRSTIPSYSSCRFKERPKITYDDLDSTLSAAIGDESLIVTSQKFNPVLFKKPLAFQRTFSEHYKNKSLSQLKKTFKDKVSSSCSEETIITRRHSYIFPPQDKSMQFQYYGPIDGNTASEINTSINKIGKEFNCRQYNNKSKSFRESRPVSWSEETKDWLERKRFAFVMYLYISFLSPFGCEWSEF